MFTAFVDESMRRRPDDDNIYAMAAITLHATGHHDARLTLESLRLGKNPRLHWRDEPIARQLVIADARPSCPLPLLSPYTSTTPHAAPSGHVDVALSAFFSNWKVPV
ncbi:hypothetical protein AB0K05_03005 [Nonomuraea sp. NPDC049486]|uniref:hypothetical protein n=1 Tax=Nonomuraea sp. NPDC049486 TaxID=3155773 RepID=UPI00343E32E2